MSEPAPLQLISPPFSQEVSWLRQLMPLAGGTEGPGSPPKCHTRLSWQQMAPRWHFLLSQMWKGLGSAVPEVFTRCAEGCWLWDFMIPLLAHPCQRPEARIPLQVLPLFPLAAASVPSSWLSRLTWERDQGMQSSGCSQALSIAANQIFPGKSPGEVTVRSFSLACTPACVFRACGRTSMPAKVGTE